MEKKAVNLTGVPETMLWTLHNRASEAMRKDAWFQDKLAVHIYQNMQYDFMRSFGAPDSSHAMRSLIFDEQINIWLKQYPEGTIIELGCGLETQFQRCDNGKVKWLCVDVAESIAIREQFIRPTERCRHLSMSALDFAWMDEVDPSHGVFITAQGLLMYFTEPDVRQLIGAILRRFPNASLMFDVIPRWFSQKTLSKRGLRKTKHFRAPAMPWGVNNDEIERFLGVCSPHALEIKPFAYQRLRGIIRTIFLWISHLPIFSNLFPYIFLVKPQVVKSLF